MKVEKYSILKILSFICVLFIVNGCATTQKRQGGGRQEMSLKEICGQQGISCHWDTVSQIVWITSPYFKAQVLMNSQMVIINGEKIILSAPVKIKRSAVIVPFDFQRKLIEKTAKESQERKEYSIRKIREIIIDAGHGGKDPGAIGSAGTEEKGIVLDIANRLKRILEDYGIKVKMTRSTDEFISLQERTEIASRSQADFFVSIHANSSPERSAQGMEVFSLRDLGYLEKDEAQRKENHRLLFSQLAMKKYDADLEEILSDLLYNCKQTESPLLADYIVQGTAQYAKIKNRGLKDARFYVLRNTLIPSVLVEVGFLSNPQEEKLLKTSLHRQKIALGLAKSILEYASR